MLDLKFGGGFGKTILRTTMAVVFGLLFSGAVVWAAPPETMPIWRAQVRFQTCSVADAGSDDYVKIKLNAGNSTLVESEFDDFAYGSDISYDLRLESVNQVSDIDYFRVEKSGSDGWCIRRMYLIINGATIFYQYFGSAGHWLDNSGSSTRIYYIDDYNMRSRGEWLYYSPPARPSTLYSGEIQSRIRGVVGDFVAHDHLSGQQSGLLYSIRGNDFLFAYGPNAWSVDVDLEADAWFNMNIDANFQLRVGCLNGRPNFSIANLSVTSTYAWNSTDRARAFFATALAPRLNEMMKNFSFGSCSTWSFIVSPEGNLQFRRNFLPPGPTFPKTLGRPSSENTSPLKLSIINGDEIRPFDESLFIATVTSELTEDTEATISFRLPSQTTLLNPVIEAYTSGEKRSIVASESARRADGSSVFTFRDRLSAGRNTEYTVQLMYRPEENKTEHIVTCVQPDGEADVGGLKPVGTITPFEFNSGAVNPLPTRMQSSAEGCSDQRGISMSK